MKKILAITVILVLIAALGTGVWAVLNNKQIIPNQAAVVGGAAELTLDPASTTFPIDVASSIALKTTSGGQNIDGFQVVATISGEVPLDLTFVATPPPGMQTIVSSLTGTTTKTLK